MKRFLCIALHLSFVSESSACLYWDTFEHVADWVTRKLLNHKDLTWLDAQQSNYAGRNYYKTIS